MRSEFLSCGCHLWCNGHDQVPDATITARIECRGEHGEAIGAMAAAALEAFPDATITCDRTTGRIVPPEEVEAQERVDEMNDSLDRHTPVRTNRRHRRMLAAQARRAAR